MITKKFKVPTLALVFSVALNIVFLVAFAFFPASQPMQNAMRTAKKEIISTNGQIFASISRLSFRELVSYLTNRDLVEEGYTKRDLAVAALTAYHHFHLEKALSSPPDQVRTLVLAGGETIDLFPGLTEEQFDAIIRFAYQEKWPLTSKGLFSSLQNQPHPRDESLEQAFFLTPEFYSLKLLFQKTDAPQERQTLLDLALEGSWASLENLSREVALHGTFSVEMRRLYLMNMLKNHSEMAARLLLTTDFQFALKRLEDKSILDLLSLLKKESDVGTRVCLELLRSARGDAILEAAAMTLYSYAGEMPTLPINPKAVLARFSSSKNKEMPVQVLKEASVSRFHIVKDGESLWKISRQYKVKVEDIVKVNGLENDSLFPGMTLKLP